MLLHNGEMYRIARGEIPVSENNFFRTLNMGALHGQNLIRQSQQGVESWLNRVAAADGHIAVENFLEYFGVSHQTLALAYEFFEPTLCIAPMRVRSTDEIHRNVGIDENHGCGPVP